MKRKQVSKEQLKLYYNDNIIPKVKEIQLYNLKENVMDEKQIYKFETMEHYKTYNQLEKCNMLLSWYINSSYNESEHNYCNLVLHSRSPYLQVRLLNDKNITLWIKTYNIVNNQVIVKYFDDFRK